MIGLHNFRNILLIYIALFAALTFPYWLSGEVVAPYRQSAEIAAPDVADPAHIENRKFSDYANVYIPEINSHLTDRHSGWLVLWNARNELGRPINHISGFSPAYPPSWLIAKLTDNPHRFITLLSLGTCFLAGLFVLMLCRELGLHPMAGLLAAGSLAASPVFMYWLTFPMFASSLCWSAGILFALIRLDRKQDLLGWGILAFGFYSLLMTAYQQLAVFHLYILSGYGSFLIYRRWRSAGRDSATSYLATAASAIVIGGTLAVPVYMDLAQVASDSARVAPDPAFFASFLPRLDTLPSITRFLVFSTFPEIFGNPVSSPFNISYGGLSSTPLISFLVLIGLLLCLKRIWGWWLVIAIFFTFALIPSFYQFGIRHLGFNLSPIDPLYCLTLPLTIIAAYGADELIKNSQANSRLKAIAFAAVVTIASLLYAIFVGFKYGWVIRWNAVTFALAVIVLLSAQFNKVRPTLLIGALAIIGSYLSFPMMLRQDSTQIASSSPLVDTIRANLPVDAIYAVAPARIEELPPNLNATLGLSSIHSYNSLSSRRYHTLIESLGGQMQIYGRWNFSIAPGYHDALFYMSNIALVLSREKLEHNNLALIGQFANTNFYRVLNRMGCCLQVSIPPNSISNDEIRVGDPRNQVMFQATKTLDQGDFIQLDVQGQGQLSLLILSQKFHRDWTAQTLTGAGWTDAKTVQVNRIFQGVLLPAQTKKVTLQFKPFARFAWTAHIFWLLLLCLIMIGLFKKTGSPFLQKIGAPVSARTNQ